ncbi:MAG: hypothetical protein ACHQ17_11835, partial [Polyangia bacterium]
MIDVVVNYFSRAIEEFATLRRVAFRTVAGALAGRQPRGAILEQMYQIGNKSLLFVCVTLGFLGMVLVFQT